MMLVLILAGPSGNGKKKPESSTSNGKLACSILNQLTHGNRQCIEHLESIQEEILAEDKPMDQDAAPAPKEDTIWMLMLQRLVEEYNTLKQRKTNWWQEINASIAKSKDIMPKIVKRNKRIITTMKMELIIALAIADLPTILAKANLLPIVLHPVH